MPLKDQIKNYAKKVVEDRPDEHALGKMVRVRIASVNGFRGQWHRPEAIRACRSSSIAEPSI